jgi:hypothetical protein
MRRILLTFAYLLFFSYVNSQTVFTNIDISLKTVAVTDGTELFCSGSSFSFKFKLNTKAIELKGSFATIDSQVIQISPMRVDGLKKSLANLDTLEKKNLLTSYSKYELDYFTNDLHIEIINPNNQWVEIKSRKWFVWYFRVGSMPVEVKQKVSIQLFASTIIGGSLLTINAPILANGDFTKAGLIVNQMMESLTDNSKK